MKKLILLLTLCANIFALEIGTAKFVKGEVKFVNKKNNKKGTIKKGDRISLFDILVTDKNSFAVIKLDNKSTIKLNKNSQIALAQYGNEDGLTKVRVNKGSSFFNVLKNLQSKKKVKFQVVTRTAAMGVRGTTFYVGVSKSRQGTDTWMCVNEGTVEASKFDEKNKVNVKTGEGVRISLYDKIAKPRPLPWTQGLNWSFEGKSEELENKLELKDAYKDILDQDYD